MNNKYFVSFETAKVLKEKGYSLQDSDYYWMMADGDKPELIHHFAKAEFGEYYDAIYIPSPTYHEVVDWFKEKNILFSITCDFYVNTTEPWYRGAIMIPDMSFDKTRLTNTSSTYEECVNELINKAIELI